MLDAPAQPTPTPPPVIVPTTELAVRDPNTDMVRGLMIIALLGIGLVVAALLLLRWPVLGQDSIPYDYGTHPERLAVAGNGPRGAAGLLIDLSVYVIVLAAAVMALRTLRTGQRQWVGGLVIAGLLGLAYVIGMVLYIGPMVSACGFSLIVFGALVAWIAGDQDQEEGEQNTPHDQDQDQPDQADQAAPTSPLLNEMVQDSNESALAPGN
ncbi:MAG: hypothetical protein U0528_07395 [Anaerolineae bacterium]